MKTVIYLIIILFPLLFICDTICMSSELSLEVLTAIRENQKTIDSVKNFHAMTERIDHIKREQGNRTLYVVQEVWYDANNIRTDVKDSKFIGQDTTDLILEEYPNGQKRLFSPPPIGSLDTYSKGSWLSFYRGTWVYIHPYKWDQMEIINRCPILRYNMYRVKTLQKLVMDNAEAGYIFKAQHDTLNGQECIFLTCNNPDDNAVTKVWVVPSKGYCIRKIQIIMGGKVIFEYETTLKEYSPGLWWFDIVIQKRWKPQEEDPFETIELSVKSLKFNEPIDPKVFTIAGTNIPPGTKVRDKISGRDYVYGISGMALLPLIDKSLPSLKDFGIDLLPSDAKDKMILVCFFEIQQRPSRNCIMQLSQRAQARPEQSRRELKAKDVVIVAVQASKIEQTKLDNWIKEHKIPFPVGMIQDDEEKVRFSWGVKSLPWLILTDKDHIVCVEGIAISELDTHIGELSPASKADFNQVTGIVRNPEGRLLADVKVTEFQTDKKYTTDKEGKFSTTYGPSDEMRVFFAVDKQHKMVGVGRLPPGQRQVEINIVPARMVSGTVVDPEGKPIAGAQVTPLPMTCYHVLTDDEGKFDVGWSPQWAGDLKVFYLMARHLKHNLAGGIEISTETENIRIELEPALALAGTVEEPNGAPIAGAEVNISLIRGWGAGTPVKEVITDELGRFEFPALLQKQEYGLGANADNFWRNAIKTGIINRTTDREEIGTIILKRPILLVTGVVVDFSGRAIASIPVHLRGNGQPYLDSKTDEEGRFRFDKVCAGPVQISAKNQTLFGVIDTQGGAMNVKIVVSPRFDPVPEAP